MEVGEAAVLRRRPVFGRTTLGRSARREQEDLTEQQEHSDFSPDFVFYSDDEKLERSEAISSNCVDIISNQERGCGRKFQPVKFSSDFGARQALTKTIVREHPWDRSQARSWVTGCAASPSRATSSPSALASVRSSFGIFELATS